MSAAKEGRNKKLVSMTKEEKEKFEKLRKMGIEEKVILQGIDEAEKFIPPLLFKFVVDNKLEIVHSFSTQSVALKKKCPVHPICHSTSSNVDKPKKMDGLLEAAIDALATVFLDIFLLIMGLLGFPSLNVSAKEFLKALNKSKMTGFFDTETLLDRMRKIKKWDNDFSLLKEFCVFFAEAKGFHSAFMALINALYYAVTSDVFTMVQAILCLFAQMIVWVSTGGAQLIASIFLVLSAGFDLIVHIKDAVNKWEAYLAKK